MTESPVRVLLVDDDPKLRAFAADGLQECGMACQTAKDAGDYIIKPFAFAELVAINSRAVEVSRLTGAAFDCTFAAVGKLWDFKQQPPVVPSDEDVPRQLLLVDSQRITVDPEKSTVEIPAGMNVGLGDRGRAQRRVRPTRWRPPCAFSARRRAWS